MKAILTGDKEVDKRFDALTGPKQKAFLRQGARAGGSVLIKETKPRIPNRKRRNDKGKLVGLKKSIMQIPSSKWRNAADMRRQGIIGTRVGFGKGGNHAHLVEYGHKVGVQAGYKRRPGSLNFVPPHPFMRPAVEVAKGGMRSAFQAKIIAGINKVTK